MLVISPVLMWNRNCKSDAIAVNPNRWVASLGLSCRVVRCSIKVFILIEAYNSPGVGKCGYSGNDESRHKQALAVPILA